MSCCQITKDKRLRLENSDEAYLENEQDIIVTVKRHKTNRWLVPRQFSCLKVGKPNKLEDVKTADEVGSDIVQAGLHQARALATKMGYGSIVN